MKKSIVYVIVLTILLVTLGFGFAPAPGAAAASLPAHERGDATYVPGQLIVGLVPSASQGPVGVQAAGLAHTLGARVLKSGGNIALLGMDAGANLRVMETQVARMKGVSYVEPNYIYRGVDSETPPADTPPTDYIIREMQGRNSPDVIKVAYPVAGLQAMKSKVNGALVATYPNDPFLWWNSGYKFVGADIVSSNTTSSKGVCVLDTGIDYKHPELSSTVTKGYDFVNADTDPMDDQGFGTHAAGIIAAKRNNSLGIAGVSTGKVVAVKVMDDNNYGTAYDISLGIQYCADRSDVSILLLGMAGPYSASEQNALSYAVATKGKLVVAGAGDGSTTAKAYPAGFSTGYAFSYGVAAVASAGKDSGSSVNYQCQANFTNHGSWITLVAPGTAIFSTMPYDKPFGMHQWYGYKERYDYTTGTNNAAAFVAATAARAWGYQTSLTNASVIQRLKDTGFSITADGVCWALDMAGIREVNVARALDRGAVSLSIQDALTDLPLAGATASIYSGSSLKGSTVMTTSSPIDPKTDQVNMVFNTWADVINLPGVYTSWTTYTPKASATNYTTSPQAAFLGDTYWSNPNGDVWLTSGAFSLAGIAYLPPKSPYFVVTSKSGISVRPYLAVWLPTAYKYIVSPTFYNPAFGDQATIPYGSLNGFPYARWINYDATYEAITIRNRPSDSAAPYFDGTYNVGISDNLTSGTNYLDSQFISALVWKDGTLKIRVNKTITCGTSAHWWWPLQINSPLSGAATYTEINTCSTLALGAPY